MLEQRLLVLADLRWQSGISGSSGLLGSFGGSMDVLGAGVGEVNGKPRDPLNVFETPKWARTLENSAPFIPVQEGCVVNRTSSDRDASTTAKQAFARTERAGYCVPSSLILLSPAWISGPPMQSPLRSRATAWPDDSGSALGLTSVSPLIWQPRFGEFCCSTHAT